MLWHWHSNGCSLSKVGRNLLCSALVFSSVTGALLNSGVTQSALLWCQIVHSALVYSGVLWCHTVCSGVLWCDTVTGANRRLCQAANGPLTTLNVRTDRFHQIHLLHLSLAYIYALHAYMIYVTYIHYIYICIYIFGKSICDMSFY